jgi:hypothetical protein
VLGSWFVGAIWAAFVVVFAVLWISFGARLGRSARSLLHPRAVAEFARTHGWSYEARGWRPLRPGPPYWSGNGAACTHVVSGTYRGEPFSAYDYDHSAQVVTLGLPALLPLLDVRPRDLDAAELIGVPSITLESVAFARRFAVHADVAKFASDILHPRLMEDLMRAPLLCWRIWEDHLVGWWPGEPAPSRILVYLEVLHTIKAAIPEFVLRDYDLTDTTTE